MTQCILKYLLEIFASSCIQSPSKLNNQTCAPKSLMTFD